MNRYTLDLSRGRLIMLGLAFSDDGQYRNVLSLDPAGSGGKGTLTTIMKCVLRQPPSTPVAAAVGCRGSLTRLSIVAICFAVHNFTPALSVKALQISNKICRQLLLINSRIRSCACLLSKKITRSSRRPW